MPTGLGLLGGATPPRFRPSSIPEKASNIFGSGSAGAGCLHGLLAAVDPRRQ